MKIKIDNWDFATVNAMIEGVAEADRALEVLSLDFARGNGSWCYGEDLPFFRNRGLIAKALQAGERLNSKRLEFLRVHVEPKGTTRPDEFDADPEGRCTSAYYLRHASYGWREYFCQGGATHLHVIMP